MVDRPAAFERLEQVITDRTATIGVCGLGYVGLPLAAAICRAGFRVIGFDIDCEKIAAINEGRSYIGAVQSEELSTFLITTKLRGTTTHQDLSLCDVIIICV